jgi:hypothetical protein
MEKCSQERRASAWILPLAEDNSGKAIKDQNRQQVAEVGDHKGDNDLKGR